MLTLTRLVKMEFFAKHKSVTINKTVSPSATITLTNNGKGANASNGSIINTAKKALSTADTNATPKTTLKNNKKATTPVRSNINKNNKRKARSSEKKKNPRSSKQAAFMANFFGAKKKKKKIATDTKPDAKHGLKVFTKETTSANNSNDSKIKLASPPATTKSSSLFLNKGNAGTFGLQSSPSATSPLNTCGTNNNNSSKQVPNLFFMAKKKKKLTMESNSDKTTKEGAEKKVTDVTGGNVNTQNDCRIDGRGQQTTKEKLLEAEEENDVEDSDEVSEEDSDDSSSDESGLEDDENEMDEIDPKQLQLQAEQKLKDVSVTYYFYRFVKALYLTLKLT